jgi:hypothetical protein
MTILSHNMLEYMQEKFDVKRRKQPCSNSDMYFFYLESCSQ